MLSNWAHFISNLITYKIAGIIVYLLNESILKNRYANNLLNIYASSVTVFSIFILFFFIENSYAQNYSSIKFEQISMKDGLSHGSVWTIVQDKQGFLWVGTEDGLNRFDGTSFKIFKNNPKKKNSLVYNYVKSLYQDHNSVLWVGTRNGLSLFDSKQDTFKNFITDPLLSNSISGNTIQEITEDKNYNLWIATRDGGLSKLDSSRKVFTHYAFNPLDSNSISSNTVWSVQTDKNDNLWVGTIDGFNKLDPVSGKISRFMTGKKLSAFVIYIDRNNVLWIGTWGNGLIKYNIKSGEYKEYINNSNDPYSISNNRILSVFEDRSGGLWVGTSGGGMDRMDREKERFTHFKQSRLKNNSISHNYANFITEDKAGTLWVGTWGGGLNRYDRLGKKFVHFCQNLYNKQSLSNNEVSELFEDSSGTLWVGTVGGGLNKYKSKTQQFFKFKNKKDDAQSLSSDVVLTIYEDKKKNLWIGTEGGGLNLFNKRSEKFKRYLHDSKNLRSISHNDVRAILEDSNGNLWLGTWGGGLNKFDQKSQTFKNYRHEAGNTISLSNDFIRVIFQDEKGIIWIGTNNGGLNRFDSDTETFTHYKYNPHDSTSLSHNAVTVIFQDSNKNLWIGTRGGLNKFDVLSRSFKIYNKSFGLPNDQIHGILEDDKGFLWISTNKGLSKFHPQKGIIKNYDEKDGIQSNQFKSNSYCKGKNGLMYFGGINGFNVFHPDSIVDNSYKPPVIITDFKIFNKPVKIGQDSPLQKRISETESITLSYKQTFFSFEFVALNFIDSEKNSYAYKLENFDEDWIYTGERRIATYTNIPSGEYLFKVKASNNDGIWNEQGTAIKIIITPPFWERWWFISLGTILILGSALAFYKIRIYQIKKQKNILEDLVNSRTEEIVNKSNEIKAQRDYLEEAQKTIFEQNIKLTNTNQELEKQVELRTSELKEAYQELLIANEELDLFIYRSAHDLQGPIARLMGLCYVAKLEVSNAVKTNLPHQNAAILDYLDKLETASKEMKYILARIIRTRKIKNKEIEFNEINFSKLIDDVIDNLCQNKNSEKLVWHIEVNQNVKFYSDDYLLNVLLSDLIGNSLNFKNEELDQNHINICVRNENESELVITIQDNGIGIPSEISLKLFDMFFVGTEMSKGFGLGLYEAKIIVEKLNGRIFLDLSNTDFTEFKIILPLEI